MLSFKDFSTDKKDITAIKPRISGTYLPENTNHIHDTSYVRILLSELERVARQIVAKPSPSLDERFQLLSQQIVLLGHLLVLLSAADDPALLRLAKRKSFR